MSSASEPTPAPQPLPQRAFLDALQERLTALRNIGRGRQLRATTGVDFASNDYLGLAAAPLPVEFAGSTGSRLLSGHTQAWQDCEAYLAAWHQGSAAAPLAALYFPSGYVANEGLLATLIGREDQVFSDALNHGSIIDGLRLSRARVHVFPHQDLDALDQLIGASPRTGRRFVVTESLFGMDGDLTDLPRLAALCQRHGALLIVDEAHATGCFGDTGAGLIEANGVREHVFASIHTCGKALGSHGAYVIAPAVVRDYLIQTCRHFIFTTSLPTAVARVTKHQVKRCRADASARQRLAARAQRVRNALEDAFRGRSEVPPHATAHILPIMLGADDRAQAWATALLDRGMRVPAIRSPAVPEGKAILRISLRADHTDAEIDGLIEALTELAHRPPPASTYQEQP